MKVKVHVIQKCRIGPKHKTLEPYMSFTEKKLLFWEITFIYLVQGEPVQHSFNVPRFVPTFIGQSIAAHNRNIFERRVLRAIRGKNIKIKGAKSNENRRR